MSKKVTYHITGFDCPNCAAKTERYLNKQKPIDSCTIDFNNERLYLSFKENELSIDEIRAMIKEVESDPIQVTKLSEKQDNKSVFDKDFFIKLGRIVATILIAVFTKIFVKDEYFVVALVLYTVAALICLYDIIWKLIRNIIKLNNPIDMNLLLTISSLGVIILSSLIHYGVLPEGPFEIDIFDGVLVVALYQTGELFEHIASNKSKKAIRSAVDLRVKIAHVIREDEVVDIAPEELVVGQKILVNVGDVIPVDGVVVSGKGTLDTSSLTGESLPVEVGEDSQVLSGCILQTGSLTILVQKAYSDSTVAKIIEMIESSGERKSKTEKFINRFAHIYTPMVFIIGIIYLLIYGLITKVWPQAIFGALAILVVSCPCAIVISVPLAFFAGIGLASKHGIIIKGTNYLDSLCHIGTLFIDKTGTLTYGHFAVSDEYFVTNKDELYEALYIAESRSNHPLAKAITKDVDVSKYSSKIDEYEEIAGKGIRAKVGKDIYVVGTKDYLEKNSAKVQDNDAKGTIIYVSKNAKYLGYVTLKDQIRDNAKTMVQLLNQYGIKVVLLSGDKPEVVEEVSREVGITEYHSSLLPIDKTTFVDAEVEKTKKVVAFAGDGINDAPSLVRADLGFAMGGIGSDMTIESSNIILMEDNPKRIVDAIVIAKKVKRVAMFNIIFSLLVKATVIVLILAGLLKQYGMIIAVLSDTGLTVLMILHSLSLIYRKIK